MFIMKYPQDWFHYLGKVRACARALLSPVESVLLKPRSQDRVRY